MTIAVKLILNKLANSLIFDKDLYFVGGTALDEDSPVAINFKELQIRLIQSISLL